MIRLLLLLFACAVILPGCEQAVEFPYSAYPRQFWERELVWMKNIGIRKIAITIPRNWEETANTPRGDLTGLLRILRRLDMTAEVQAERDTSALQQFLDPQRKIHGGVIVENAPPPVSRVTATSPAALARSREILSAGCGELIWADVEDTIAPMFHAGAISFNGDEQPSLTALRRSASLMHYWGSALKTMHPLEERIRTAAAPLPAGITATQLAAPDSGVSVVSVINRMAGPWRGELRVYYPPAKRHIGLPAFDLPPGQALWLPVNVPLGNAEFCRNCSALGNGDSIVYATAELTLVEYENGILAMEFAAPAAAEVVLQLSREPSGPLLAAGKPTSFDWDEHAMRLRLPIPAGKTPGNRVRIGIAIEPPDTSGFFVDPKVLIIGEKNHLAAEYSSDEVAQRSRLKLPPGLKAEPQAKSSNVIDYVIEVPKDALHGDHVELALEADGVQMSHVRLQLLRPASLRIRAATSLHYGQSAELPVAPPLVPVDQKAGRNINITIRNNFPEIRNYTLEIAGEGLEFSPAKTEISIGPSMERDVAVRVFADNAGAGLHAARLKLTGAANVELPAQFIVIPRTETVAYSADLDEDGSPEYILETHRVRAVFSGRDGGRWMEFVWKDSGRNMLPVNGVNVGVAKVQLRDADLILDQEKPGEMLKAGKQGDVVLDVKRAAAGGRVTYTLSKAP